MMKNRNKIGIIKQSSDLKLHIVTHNNAAKHSQEMLG